jgi:DNA-binding CsgD family transcriptional regulator
MDLLAVATKRTVPGILVFNHRKKPEFFNQGALDFFSMLSGAKTPSTKKHARQLKIPKVIFGLYDSLVENFKSTPQPQQLSNGRMFTQTVLVSVQEATFCCRGFFITERHDSMKKAFHIMILIEKVSAQRYEVDLEKFRERFNLTGRQLEIVKPLMTGASNKEIANKLCISEDTIKGHLKHIMRQTGVSSRTELLSMIFQH